MKLKIKKIILSFIKITIFFLVNVPVFANTNNFDKTIYVESDKQTLDIQRNIVIFSGNVTITQGSIKIGADTVIFTNQKKNPHKKFIDSYGRYATFQYKQKNGKIIRGHAFRMHYEILENLVVLTGNAYLEQANCSISGHEINYLINEQRIRVLRKKNKRVTTVLESFRH